MYYNPNTNQSISSQELKNLLNISFPEGREQIQEWLLVHDELSEQEGKIAIKDSIVLKDGKAIQTYQYEDVPISENSETSIQNIVQHEIERYRNEQKHYRDEMESEEVQSSNAEASSPSIVDGAIMELAAMIANLQVYCTTAIEEMKKTSKDS